MELKHLCNPLIELPNDDDNDCEDDDADHDEDHDDEGG